MSLPLTGQSNYFHDYCKEFCLVIDPAIWFKWLDIIIRYIYMQQARNPGSGQNGIVNCKIPLLVGWLIYLLVFSFSLVWSQQISRSRWVTKTCCLMRILMSFTFTNCENCESQFVFLRKLGIFILRFFIWMNIFCFKDVHYVESAKILSPYLGNRSKLACSQIKWKIIP